MLKILWRNTLIHMRRRSRSLGWQQSQHSPAALFSLEATPQHQRGYHLLGEAKCSCCRLKGAQSPGQKDRHRAELPRADPLGHEGMWSDGLRKGCPPNISILAADGCVLPAGLHIHVIEGRLPYHVVCPCELYSISRLQGWSMRADPTPKCLARPREPCFCRPSPLVTSGRGIVATPRPTHKPIAPFRDTQ